MTVELLRGLSEAGAGAHPAPPLPVRLALMLKGCSPMQELCHVTVEKPPKAPGGGRVKESKNNRTDQSSQVSLDFCVDSGGKRKSPLILAMTTATLGFFFFFFFKSPFYLQPRFLPQPFLSGGSFLTKFHIIGSIHQRLHTHIKEIKTL